MHTELAFAGHRAGGVHHLGSAGQSVLLASSPSWMAAIPARHGKEQRLRFAVAVQQFPGGQGHGFLCWCRYQPVTGHEPNLRAATGIPEEVKRRFLPGPDAGGSTPQIR